MSVRAQCSSEDDQFWFKAIVNGHEVGRSIPVASNAAFESIEARINETLTAVYEKGKQDGAKEARLAMRTAIGF